MEIMDGLEGEVVVDGSATWELQAMANLHLNKEEEAMEWDLLDKVLSDCMVCLIVAAAVVVKPQRIQVLVLMETAVLAVVDL